MVAATPCTRATSTRLEGGNQIEPYVWDPRNYLNRYPRVAVTVRADRDAAALALRSRAFPG
jgi:hypothetical protein